MAREAGRVRSGQSIAGDVEDSGGFWALFQEQRDEGVGWGASEVIAGPQGGAEEQSG